MLLKLGQALCYTYVHMRQPLGARRSGIPRYCQEPDRVCFVTRRRAGSTRFPRSARHAGSATVRSAHPARDGLQAFLNTRPSDGTKLGRPPQAQMHSCSRLTAQAISGENPGHSKGVQKLPWSGAGGWMVCQSQCPQGFSPPTRTKSFDRQGRSLALWLRGTAGGLRTSQVQHAVAESGGSSGDAPTRKWLREDELEHRVSTQVMQHD